MNSLEYYSVDENVFKLYRASHQATSISNEAYRILKAEDLSWSSKNAPTLINIALKSIASHFELFIDYFQSDEINEDFRSKLGYLIPTNLPLTLISTVIPEGIFWKRACFDTWSMGDFMMQFKGSWKRLYMEKRLQFHIENVHPNDINIIELKELLEITKSYIFTLNIEQLLIAEENDQDDEVHHIDLHFILFSLSTLQNFSLTCGVKNYNTEFSKNMFELSVSDCTNIGKGLQNAKNLQTYRMRRCHLNATKLRCILSHWDSLLLQEIEFMSCGLNDSCISILTEILSKLSSIKVLSLLNNQIGPNGATFLSEFLENSRSLKVLNLGLNFILDEGGIAVFTALKQSNVEKLLLEGCELSSTVIESLCQLILMNDRILEIDLSVNRLNIEKNDALIQAVFTNNTLQKIDLRMNDITPIQTKTLSEKLLRNRKHENKT